MTGSPADISRTRSPFTPRFRTRKRTSIPPYEINGHPVRSGPGWVVISASDLARFGHLIATNGVWQDERIIDSHWLRGHGGGNKSGMSGERKHVTAVGVVTTEGFEYKYGTETTSFLPEELFIGPVRMSRDS